MNLFGDKIEDFEIVEKGYKYPEDTKIGKKFIIKNGCPECGKDLCIWYRVVCWCSTGGPHSDGPCEFGLMSG